MALDSINIYCCPQCGYSYDWYNCTNCSYVNKSWDGGESIYGEIDPVHWDLSQEVTWTVEKLMNLKWQLEWTLQINISDLWSPQVVYIDYNITLQDSRNQIPDDDKIIDNISHSFRGGTSLYLKEIVEELYSLVISKLFSCQNF